MYSATKAAVIAYTQAMNKELNGDGIKSTAFCPGFVDTDMTDFVKGTVSAEEMLRPTDIAEAVRFLLRVSPACVVPDVVFQRPGETIRSAAAAGVPAEEGLVPALRNEGEPGWRRGLARPGARRVVVLVGRAVTTRGSGRLCIDGERGRPWIGTLPSI